MGQDIGLLGLYLGQDMGQDIRQALFGLYLDRITSGHYSVWSLFRQDMGQDIALFGLYLGRIWVRTLLSLVSF